MDDDAGLVAAAVVTGYVVVLLTSPLTCEHYLGRDCIQSVIVRSDGEPFADKASADAEVARWPEWCAAHSAALVCSGDDSWRVAKAMGEIDKLAEAVRLRRLRERDLP